jgi:diguanylate cyclase (GGDEF)-like protein
MSANPTLRSEYKKHFSLVIMRWGMVRQNINPNEFQALIECVQTWANWAKEEQLGLLQNTLQEVLSHIPNGKKMEDQQIADVDALLSKLVAAINKADNPFLVKNSNISSDNNAIDKERSALNIGIIDDSEIARATTKAMLDRFNFNVFVFESIFEFEENSDALEHIDIILLDVIMPNITEEMLFEFAKRIRQKDIHIILVSGVDSPEIRLQAVRCDIGGYVTKPFDINVLVSNIRWLCKLDVDRPFHVMLLDDQPLVGKFLGNYANKNEVELQYFSNSKAFFEQLDMNVPDMFLLDIRMPEISGIEVCKILRQQQRYEYVPIVFLSADNSLETKLEALKAGADDVIIKDNPPDIIFKQIERRIVRGQQIRSLSIKDSLTGLLNHGQMMAAANSAYKLALRNEGQIVVAMIDIDNFKQVNDNRGHMVGDNVLVGLAQLLKTSVRETDTVGRYGGEEFMLVFHSDNIEKIENKLNEICFTFSNLKFKDNQEQFSCTFSCGIASSKGCTELKEIIQKADQLMYEVKKNGKNGVKVESK